MEQSEGLMKYQIELMSFLEDLNETATENQKFIDDVEKMELTDDLKNTLIEAYKRQLKYAYQMVKYNKKLFDTRKTLMEI